MTSCRHLFEALAYARVGYWSLDIETQEVRWSDEIYRIFGLDPAIPAGPATLQMLLHPEDAAAVLSSLEQSCAIGVEHNLDYRIARPDGTQRWVNCRAKPVQDAAGRVIRLEGYLQDMTDRQQAVEALKDRERVLASIFRTVPIGIGLTRNRVLQEVNNGFCTMLGYPREALIGCNFRDLYPSDGEFERVGREKYAQIQEKGHGEVETQLRHKDGHLIDVIIGSTVVDSDSEAREVTFTVIDISARKAAERKAQESGKLFTEAFHAAGTMLTISSIDEGVYEHVNDTFVELTGYTREDAIGNRSVDLGFISETQRQRLVESLGTSGRVRDLELRLIRKDGSLIDCLYNGAVIEVGGAKKLLSIAQDITPLKESQWALQASEERFVLAMRGSNDGVFDWDLQTNRVYYSPRWKSMLGYGDDELENNLDSWERLVDPGDRVDSWNMLQNYIDGKRDNFATEFRMRHRDGHWVEVLSRAYLARDAGGKPIRVVGTHVDITERKHAERQIAAERARAERYLKVAGSILLALDCEGRVSLINPKGCEVIGLAESEILGRDWVEHFIPKEDRDSVTSIFQHLLQDKGPAFEYVERRLLTARGDKRLIAWHNRAVHDERGELIGTLSSGEDVTERRAAEQALREERRFLQDIIDGIEDPILVMDCDRRIQRMNRSAQAQAVDIGPVSKELRCHQLMYQSDVPCAEASRTCPMTAVLRSGKPCKILHQVTGIDSSERTHELAASPLRDEDGSIKGIIEISRDVTDQVELLEALRAQDLRYAHLAQHDPLTELPNRFLFSDRLSQAIQIAERSRSKLAVLFIDLDQFKQINDSFDHSDGDAVLVALARRLEGLIRGADTLARMGGDEFSIILGDIKHDEDAAKVAREVLALFKKPFEIRGHRLFLGASIGISLYPEQGLNGEDLIRNADAALFRAKAEGRNNFQYYSQDLTAKAFERILLESSLHDAIANQELVLYYQPQLHLPSGKICGVEALVRWRHPSMGLVPPDRFIPLAESTGLIVPMGEWVLRKACAQMQHWLQTGQLAADATMAVNLSARQLTHEDLVTEVKDALESTQLPAVNLELEITESSLMASPERSAMRLGHLRDLNVKLALDDFGTGYSSLSHLKQLPLTKIKIDRSFVSDIPQDANDTAITKAIVALGNSLSLELLAEGIETERQRDFLIEEGCEQGQGYLFSKPIPAAEVETLFALELGRT